MADDELTIRVDAEVVKAAFQEGWRRGWQRGMDDMSMGDDALEFDEAWKVFRGRRGLDGQGADDD